MIGVIGSGSWATAIVKILLEDPTREVSWWVRRDEVRAEHLEHEKEILVAQARNEGKPEKIIERMVEGRINKFYQEVCVLEQPFVKDGDISVQKMIQQKAPGADVVRFTRYKMGEGLEKKVNDLAAEVAAQTAGMAK